MKRLLHVVGARPNFMKLAPIYRELGRHSDSIGQVIVHTGQHYDSNMSGSFFDELNIPQPDFNLGIGGGSHGEQIGNVLIEIEKLVEQIRPDIGIVYGDVNATISASLIFSRLGILTVHVEAGLRSGDRSMPEEINRLLTDQLSDVLLVPSRDAVDNLTREGINSKRIHLVGNVMIDSLEWILARNAHDDVANKYGIDADYAVVTLHRPSNVDSPAKLKGVISELGELAKRTPIVFPVHPRTKQKLEYQGLAQGSQDIYFCDPLGYSDFVSLLAKSRYVLTDSGGVQEETTHMNVPCITLRDNTERPVTITEGTNMLIGSSIEDLAERVDKAFREITSRRLKSKIEMWDGQASKRIASILRDLKV